MYKKSIELNKDIINIGMFLDQRFGSIRTLETSDGILYFISKDIERLLGYQDLVDCIRKKYYYDNNKYIIKKRKIRNFIESSKNDYSIKIAITLLHDIPNRGLLILDLNGLNMLISRSLICSSRYFYQNWLYSYSFDNMKYDFYKKEI